MEYESYTMASRGSTELEKDDNFPHETGSTRRAEFSLEAGTAYKLHVHPGMKETFIAREGMVSLTILTGDRATSEVVAVTRNLAPGEEFTVEPDTPYFVFNNSGESVTAKVHQRITIPGKDTISFNIASGNMVEQLISESL